MDQKENRSRRLARILDKIAKGRKSGLKEFYELYCQQIISTAMTVSGVRDDCDIILNEVMVKVWQMAGYLTNVDNFDGWLYTVTLNIAKDHVRTDNWVELSATVTSEDLYEKMESEDAFYSLVAELPPFEREVCVDRFIWDMTFVDIAALTGRPISTVNAAYHRALAKIKDKIKKHGRF